MTTTTLPETTTLAGTAFPGLVPGTWVIDPTHSEVGFTVRHLMSKVRGHFRDFEGSLTIADNPLESAAHASVELSSVDTRNADRDAHLRSADFFSVETSPKMTFQTTSLRRDGDDHVATGALTIRDITKPVELAVEFLGVEQDHYGNTRAGFEATTQISRKDWGIAFNIPLDGDKMMIGDKVNIVLTVEAVHQA